MNNQISVQFIKYDCISGTSSRALWFVNGELIKELEIGGYSGYGGASFHDIDDLEIAATVLANTLQVPLQYRELSDSDVMDFELDSDRVTPEQLLKVAHYHKWEPRGDYANKAPGSPVGGQPINGAIADVYGEEEEESEYGFDYPGAARMEVELAKLYLEMEDDHCVRVALEEAPSVYTAFENHILQQIEEDPEGLLSGFSSAYLLDYLKNCEDVIAISGILIKEGEFNFDSDGNKVNIAADAILRILHSFEIQSKLTFDRKRIDPIAEAYSVTLSDAAYKRLMSEVKPKVDAMQSDLKAFLYDLYDLRNADPEGWTHARLEAAIKQWVNPRTSEIYQYICSVISTDYVYFVEPEPTKVDDTGDRSRAESQRPIDDPEHYEGELPVYDGEVLDDEDDEDDEEYEQ